MRRLLIFSFVILLTVLIACQPDGPGPSPNPTPYRKPDTVGFTLPPLFPQVNLPADNPLTKQGIALGKALFYDPILSLDITVSCNSCHVQQNAFADQPINRYSKGVNGTLGSRNAMPLFNFAWRNNGFFWDGRADLLRHQSTMPVKDPKEMKENIANVILKLKRSNRYAPLFGKAFGDETINEDRIQLALEQFLHTLVSSNSKFDKWKRGMLNLSPEEMRGFTLFMGEYKAPGQAPKSGGNASIVTVEPCFPQGFMPATALTQL